jgi:hypothetical protein
VRQTPVAEQSFSEQQTLRVPGSRRRNWRYRLLAGASLIDWRLSVCLRNRVEADERQQETRKNASVHGRRHRRHWR